ncbi:hypothetical protein [Sphingobium sp. EM0848]|nr:hypothetical protein [Sphingobium sp. EM0848]
MALRVSAAVAAIESSYAIYVSKPDFVAGLIAPHSPEFEKMQPPPV